MKDRQALGISSSEITILAQKALNIIAPDQIILMDGGTTNRYIAEQFPDDLRATVITNSPPLAVSLSSHAFIEVILLGGSFHKNYQITLGCEASAQLRHFRADLYFMGIVGVHPSEGLTIRHYEESLLKRQMMKIAQKTVIGVTSEKYLNIEAYQICSLQEVDIILTSNQTLSDEIESWQLTSCVHF
jgi:DeoR/GlpR family transcriptional regulator of sugar metabolism